MGCLQSPRVRPRPCSPWPTTSPPLSLDGVGSVTTLQTERDRLWTPIANVWFDGPEDENLAVFTFEVTSGSYWSGPGNVLVRGVGLVYGQLTGDDGSLGEHGAIASDGGRS